MFNVIPANEYIEKFLNVYLSDEDYNQLLHLLKNNPKIRAFWGNTKYRYVIQNKIYFLYEVIEEKNLVIILGVKFNNKRKTFNFADTQTRVKIILKWIENKINGKY